MKILFIIVKKKKFFFQKLLLLFFFKYLKNIFTWSYREVANTVMCTLHDFLSSKARFIQTNILDCILALENTTRTPRVHLVTFVY